MLTLNEGIFITQQARRIISSHILKKPMNLPEHPSVFHEKRGVFVTLHTYPDFQLRGCIGIPYPVMSLDQAVKEAAVSATQDPRFPVLNQDELDTIIVEVTVLTTPTRIKVDDKSELPDHIRIGQDGLIIKLHGRSGLLLPQVPIEQGWDAETFLTNLCFKAGLSPDAWFEKNVEIYQFSGQIFAENTPNGNIQEKQLDEL